MVNHIVAAFTVRQSGLFIHIEIIVDKVAQTSQKNRRKAAHKQEQHDSQHRKELQIQCLADRNAAFHGDIVRALNLIVFADGLDGNLIQLSKLRRQFFNALACPLCLLALRVRVLRHAAVCAEDFLRLALVDICVNQIGLQIRIMVDEFIIGCRNIAVRHNGIAVPAAHDVRDNLRRAGVASLSSVACAGGVDRRALNRLVAKLVDDALCFRNILGQAVNLKLILERIILLFVHHHVAVLDQLIRDDIRIQIAQVVIFEIVIAVCQIRKGITGLNAVKAVFFLRTLIQIADGFIRISSKHLHAVHVFIVVHRNVDRVVGKKLRIHVLLAVIPEVIAQQRIQHPSGIARRIFIINGERNLIDCRRIAVFLAAAQRILLAQVFIIRNNLFNRHLGTDGFRIAGKPQFLNRPVDNGGGGNLRRIQFASIRIQTVLTADVGILNDRRSGVALFGGGKPVNKSTSGGDHDHDEKPPFFQVSQQIKVFHICFNLLHAEAFIQAIFCVLAHTGG